MPSPATPHLPADLLELSKTLDLLPVAVFIKDAAGRVLLMNSACEMLWGLRRADLGAGDATSFFPDEQARWFAAKDREVLAGHGPVEYEQTIHNAALGEDRIGLTVKTALRDAGGGMFVLGVSIDVTESRRRQQEHAARGAALAPVLRTGDAQAQRQARFAFDAAWCEALVASSQDAIVSKTVDGIVTSWNDKAREMFGFAASEMIGRPLLRIFPPERVDEERDLLRSIQRGDDVSERETVRLRNDGRPLDVSVSVSPIRDAAGRVVGASSIMRDISTRIAREHELAERELRWRSVLDASPDGFFMLDAEGRLTEANPAYCRLSGYSRDELVGMRIDQLDALESSDDALAHLALVPRDGSDRFETEHRRRDGSLWPVEITASHVAALGELFVFARDLTERRALEAERERAEKAIRDLAFRDPLTGLPNRRLLLDRLGQALVASERSGQLGALLFIDMDRFKELNDRLGHGAGDRFLVEVAARLNDAIRAEDTVARLGGDEFVVMLVELGWNSDEAAANCALVGAKLLGSLTVDYLLDGHVHHGTPSIGGALFAGAAVPPHAIVARADAAMYRVKSGGGNGFHLDPAR